VRLPLLYHRLTVVCVLTLVYLYVEARLVAWVVAVFGVVPYDLPCAASPVAHSHKRGLGLTELVREDVHTVVSNTC